jgi:hypothetical protein
MSSALFAILKDFTPGTAADYNQLDRNVFYRVESGGPAPHDLALFLLVRKLRCFHYQREEKLHWGVIFRYRGQLHSLELRKFGLRLVGVAEGDDELGGEIVEKLRAGCHCIESEIRSLAQERTKSGDVSVSNRLRQFDAAFDFFLKRAMRSYTRAMKAAGEDNAAHYENWQVVSRARHAGSCYASAAIETWFSRLEHVLTLVRPFVAPSLQGQGILTFMADDWAKKYHSVLGGTDPVANRIKGRLTEVREQYRNAAAHGGHAKNGASLFFHDELMGAVPFAFGHGTKKPVLTPADLRPEHFRDALSVFEEFETFFSESRARFGYLFAQSRFTVSYDRKSVERYLKHTASDAAFEQLLNYTAYWTDTVINADY